MRTSGATGVDGAPLLAVRKCFPVLGPLLRRIVNASLVSGVFPSAWKTACIVPIFKSGDRTVPSNIRAISLPSVLSKVTEKMQSADDLPCRQCDSVPTANMRIGRHTRLGSGDALIDAVAWVTDNTDQGLLSSITAVDLSKAFDSVDHGVLIEKLA